MVVGFAEGDAGELCEARDNARGEFRMCAHAGAHGGATQRKFDQGTQRLAATAAAALDLARVAEELLAEADRGGVLQVGPAGFHDGPELIRLGAQRILERLQRRDQMALDVHGSGHLDGGRDHVVARLAKIHVIVRVHRGARTLDPTEQFDGAVADHLVGVHVGGGAAACLEDVDDELVVELPVDHVLGCSYDRAGERFVEQAQVAVHLRRLLLDESERAQEAARKPKVADGKVHRRTHRVGAVVGVCGHLELAHRVPLRAGRGHDQRSS